MTTEINVRVDGRPYRGIANVDRTEFELVGVRELEVMTGSVLADEKGARYLVEQYVETLGGNARIRVRAINA